MLALVAGLYYVVVMRPAQRRDRAWRAWAEAAGYTYTPLVADLAALRPALRPHTLFSLGDRDQQVTNLIQFQRAGVELALFDYAYTTVYLTGFSQHARTIAQTVLVVNDPRRQWPRLGLWPRALLDVKHPQAQAAGVLPEDDPLAEQYILDGAPAGAVLRWFTPRRRARLAATAFSLEAEGSQVILYQEGVLVSAPSLSQFVETALGCLE